ncbi:MAG: hypothetical protein ACXAE3_10830, partial [Candidatus Kariarchaeaceae archaeon]
MSSSVAKPSERYITRRVVDAEGNIVVKRYKKAASSPIQIPWNRVPSALLGSLFGFYAYIVNLYRTDQLTNSLVFGELGESIKITLDSLNGITSLFLAGAVTVGLGAFLGYALITQGFKVKKWFAAGRQLLAILAFSILLSAVFSSFINEAGLIRQQDDPVDASDDFDLSELSAPFYSELLNGLLDLIGNIPNPQELVATITPGEGEPLFDPDVDTYLWRWLVAETYADDFDYDKGYTEYLAELENANAAAIAAAAPAADIKKFRVSQQYLTLGTSFSGETVNTWHSLLDGQVDVSNPGLELAEDIEGELRGDDAVSLQNNINNQPVLQADFTKSRTAGYLNFSSYFVEEDKQAIAENSLTYPNFTDSIKNDYDTSRFPQLGQAGGIDSIWGEESFSAGYLTTDFPGIDETYFTDKIDSYQAQADAGASVYSLVLQISNEIQNALLDLFNNPSAADTLNPSGDAATQNEAGEGTPRDFFFWEQVATGGLFGIKDAIAGFVNLVRALDIPARPILGFSLGNIQPEQIELRLEHISVWIEALVPWNDNGTIRHSWGMFNPIPNYSKLLQGEFVYGRNSLGGSPEIEIQASTGTETDVPDEAIGETSSFNLNGLGEPFSFGTRVLYEDTPSAGAPLSVKILSEAEIISLADGDIDPTQGLE